MEQQPEPIVLEVAHSVPDPSKLLGNEVLGLCWPTRDPGHVVVEDLGLPRGDGLGQTGELGDVGLGGVLVEGDQFPTGARRGRLRRQQAVDSPPTKLASRKTCPMKIPARVRHARH